MEVSEEPLLPEATQEAKEEAKEEVEEEAKEKSKVEVKEEVKVEDEDPPQKAKPKKAKKEAEPKRANAKAKPKANPRQLLNEKATPMQEVKPQVSEPTYEELLSILHNHQRRQIEKQQNSYRQMIRI